MSIKSGKIFEDSMKDMEHQEQDVELSLFSDQEEEEAKEIKARAKSFAKRGRGRPRREPEPIEEMDKDGEGEESPSVSENRNQNDLETSKKPIDMEQDFGPADMIKGKRGGTLVVHTSEQYPDKKFRYRKIKTIPQGADHFACLECFSLRQSRRVSCAVPIIYIKNGRFIGRDPNQLSVEHLCLIDPVMPSTSKGSALKSNQLSLKNVLKRSRTSSYNHSSPKKDASKAFLSPKASNSELSPKEQPLESRVKRMIEKGRRSVVATKIKRYRLSQKDYSKDFGPAETELDARFLKYKSRKYPGKTFEFGVVNYYPNHKNMRCKECQSLKTLLRLPNKVPHIYIKNGRIVGKDPDEPGTEHFCQPGLPNYPEKQLRTRRSNKDATQLPEDDENEDQGINQMDESGGTGNNVTITSLTSNQELGTHLDASDHEMDAQLTATIDVSQSKIADATHPNKFDLEELEPTTSKSTKSKDLDFGPANLQQSKKGMYLLYKSKTCPGHTYRYMLYGYLKNLPVYYKCSGCALKKKEMGLEQKFPVIMIKEGRIVERDPDCPAGIEHFCREETASKLEHINETPLQDLRPPNRKKQRSMNESTTKSKPIDEPKDLGSSKEPSPGSQSSEAKENVKDFGLAVFEKADHGKIQLVYDSKRIPGHQFRFSNMGGSFRTMYQCSDCFKIKKHKKLECRIPSIILSEGRIIEMDPDCPKNPHFCIQKQHMAAKEPKKELKEIKKPTLTEISASRRPNPIEVLSPIHPIVKERDVVEISPMKRLKLDPQFHSTPKESSSWNSIEKQGQKGFVQRFYGRLDRPVVFETSTEHLPLDEYSYLTRKLEFKSDWTIAGEYTRLPCADRQVPARKKYPINSFPKGETLVRAQKTLKEQFDLATAKFSSNNKTNALMLVDSLYYSLDETVLSNTAVVRAAYPVQPKWIMPHMQILCSMLPALPTIVYGLGHDWVLHSEFETPNYIANLAMDELDDIIEFMAKNQPSPMKNSPTKSPITNERLKVVFVTIPEIGDHKQKFQEFNRDMRIQIHDKSRGLMNCQLEILDWARLVENSAQAETVDQRFHILFAQE